MHTIKWELHPDGKITAVIECQAPAAAPCRIFCPVDEYETCTCDTETPATEKPCQAARWFDAICPLDCYQPPDREPVAVRDGEITVHWNGRIDSWIWHYPTEREAPVRAHSEWASEFHRRLRREGIRTTPNMQLSKIREELTELREAIHVWRDSGGSDKRQGLVVSEELADVVLSSYVLADILTLNLDVAIETKKQLIATRPLRKEHRTPGDQK